MNEDFQVEDEAEKMAENPIDVLISFLFENGEVSREKLIELLVEKCELSEDEAEKFLEKLVEKGELKCRKGKYSLNMTIEDYLRPLKSLRSFKIKPPSQRLARTNITQVVKLPPDPAALPCKSYLLAKDWAPYYHPSMDEHKLRMLKAKEKMGEGADWLS